MRNEEGKDPSKRWPSGLILPLLGLVLFGIFYFGWWDTRAITAVVDRYPTVAYPLLSFLALLVARRRIRRYEESGRKIYIASAVILGLGSLVLLAAFLRHC